ncbi:MAG: ABC transporter ATP-binding protein [Candidatus Acidiferrales bacterium]
MSMESPGRSVPAAPIPGAAATSLSVPEPRLKVEQLHYAYAATERAAPEFSLGPISFEARQREMLTILGPNASGKSTLLKLIAGVLPPVSGRVETDGVSVAELFPRARAQKIALVQQESALLFPLRVWEFVLQGRYPYGRRLRFESTSDCHISETALAQVGAEKLRDRWMNQLSGGEKQRVILARALAQQPALLLLDEPTQHLDIGGKVELLRRLRRLARENRYTVVVVTHELNLAAEFADRVVLMHKGKCVREGTPAEVYTRAALEPVFDAPLDVEMSASGRPRVILRANAESSEGEGGTIREGENR